MAIYGVALLSFCMFIGVYFGDVLGVLLGVKANVGGVGFAMLFVILLTNHGIDNGWLTKKAQDGISFWNAMYIPIVVAMTSLQDVVAAVKGGPLALTAGVLGVVVAFAFVPILGRMSSNRESSNNSNHSNISK